MELLKTQGSLTGEEHYRREYTGAIHMVSTEDWATDFEVKMTLSKVAMAARSLTVEKEASGVLTMTAETQQTER